MLRLAAIKRSWVQWSLRGFMVAVALLAVAFAWYGARLRREARINDAVRLIAASPSWFPSGDFDPIALVRAVNALHLLGKHDALIALRRFASEFPSTGGPSDKHENLHLVIALLFDRADPEDKFPSPAPWDGMYPLDHKEWAYYSDLIVVEGDIPFHIDPIMFSTGEMGDFTYAIDWAQKYGRFRSTPLRPVDSLFELPDKVILELVKEHKRQGDTKRFDAPGLIRRHLREQVVTAIAHLLPDGECGKYLWRRRKNSNDDRDLEQDDYRDLGYDAVWRALRKTCEPLGIRWSNERQAYVAVNG